MPNKYTTPKTDFLKETSTVTQHSRLIEQPSFTRAIEVAKAEYFRRLNAMAVDTSAPNAASTGSLLFQRMQGVEDFCLVLFNLGEPIELPKKPSDNLNLDQLKRS